jgi:hypothetical protein
VMNAQPPSKQECKIMEDLKFAKLEDHVKPRTTQKESFPELDALPGTWLNISGGIGKVIITSQKSKLRLRVFGAAAPDLRDWGEVEAEHIYANNITSQDADSSKTFAFNFAKDSLQKATTLIFDDWFCFWRSQQRRMSFSTGTA